MLHTPYGRGIGDIYNCLQRIIISYLKSYNCFKKTSTLSNLTRVDIAENQPTNQLIKHLD